MAFTSEEALQVGEEIGIDWDMVEFDPEDLAAGMDVETEHGSKLGEEFNLTDDDPNATAQIAWAHLHESPDYYDLLVEMETEMDEDDLERSAYTAPEKQVKPGQQKADKPEMSAELESIVFQYTDQLEAAIAGGMSANDAFNSIVPDLDSLAPDDLVNLLYENQHIGGRGSLSKFKDWLPALDIFDLVQKLLERHIWEAAVYWWGTRKTELQGSETEQRAKKPKQKRTEEEQQAAEKREEISTQVLPKEGSFVYRGRRYEELIR